MRADYGTIVTTGSENLLVARDIVPHPCARFEAPYEGAHRSTIWSLMNSRRRHT